MTKIGFIGLGIMGEAMAKRLLNNGYELVVYNRTKDKVAKLSNAIPAESPSDVAKSCDLIISMLADSKAVEDVVYSENGILTALKSGLIHIDMSTISPSTTTKLYREYKERNAYFIHAPVLGSKTQAENGTLLIFAGGDKEAIKKCEVIFKILGKKFWEFDSAEKATVLKLVMNSMIAMMMMTLSQAFVLGEKFGIPKETILEILENSALNSTMYQNKGKSIIDGNYNPNFYTKHMLKDINLLIETAQAQGINLPVMNAVRELYNEAISKGYENEDYCAIYKVLAELISLKIQ